MTGRYRVVYRYWVGDAGDRDEADHKTQHGDETMPRYSPVPDARRAAASPTAWTHDQVNEAVARGLPCAHR
jgi:hypothetical protein